MTISIGICAYNEEQNIAKLLGQIRSQKISVGRLEKIIVLSDGSTDNTVKIASHFADKRITVIADPIQKGKSQQLNRLFKEANSDILILLDADLELSTDALSNLLKAFSEDASISLASGRIIPLKPLSFTQKALFAGYKLMDQAKKDVRNNDAYSCTGAIRGMRKSLYKVLKFPRITAEDIYPFFYCISKGLKYKTVEEAVIYYELPKTYKFYLNQMRRYLSSPIEHKNLFSPLITGKYFTITPLIKIKAFFKRLSIDPFWTSVYIVYLLLPKIFTLLVPYKTGSTWIVEK